MLRQLLVCCAIAFARHCDGLSLDGLAESCGATDLTVIDSESVLVTSSGVNWSADDMCIRKVASLSDLASLTVDLTGLGLAHSYFPVNLFTNATPTLRHLFIRAPNVLNGELRTETFQGLDNLEVLTLEGLEGIRRMNESVFRPLRRLRSLTLIAVGQYWLTYSNLSAALQGLESTPLTNLTLNAIHSLAHWEKVLDFSMLNIRNVSLEFFILINNDINSVANSRLSTIQSLRSLRLAVHMLSAAFVYVTIVENILFFAYANVSDNFF